MRLNGAAIPLTETLNRSKDRAASDGICPTTAVASLQGHHRTAVSPPAPLDFTATSLDVFYTAAPASTRCGASTEKTRRGLPDLRLHRGTHYDSNNGIRARLPLCDSNPNRVKETEKGPRVAEVTGTPVTTATAREKCRTDTARKNRSVFGSEKK